MDVLFYQLHTFDSTEPFLQDDFERLSNGFAEPFFLSKFGYEPSYNKRYRNLLKTGMGDMRNGTDLNSFSFYTSLGTAKNQLGIQDNLTNDLSVFWLPKKLLPFYEINNSYIFLMHYNFFFKDFVKNNFDNRYSHVLYQRYPKEGVEILLRADFQVNITPTSQNLLLRYFINQQIKRQLPFELPLTRTDELQQIPFNFIMIQVQQNSIKRIPNITFINGYNLEQFSLSENFQLLSSDQHLIGDAESRDTQRKEYLTFIQINEVMFLRGSTFQQDTSNNSPILYYSGLESPEYVLTCKNTNNPQRNTSNDPNLPSTLNNCNNFQKVTCGDNCDICSGAQCSICKPGYEIDESDACRKCEENEGYDPTLKACYIGTVLTDFFETQYGNLNASIMNLDIGNNYFLATAKFEVDKEIFLNNAFLMFINNVDSQNRLLDICWDSSCIDQPQEMYFALSNQEQSKLIDKIIIGNTGTYSIQPQSLILSLQEKAAFNPTDPRYKNFNCGFLGDYYFQIEAGNSLIGRCVRQCNSGYFKNFNNQTCTACPVTCLTCVSSDSCLSCPENQALVVGQCLPCQRPCLTCQNSPNICTTCVNANMFFDGRCNRLCRNKSALCDICDIYTGNCLKCKSGYILRGNNCEEDTCGVTNCNICLNTNTCRLCLRGYQLQNGKCNVCQRNCSFCPFGYKLNLSGSCIRTSLVQETQGSSSTFNETNQTTTTIENTENTEVEESSSPLSIIWTLLCVFMLIY